MEQLLGQGVLASELHQGRDVGFQRRDVVPVVEDRVNVVCQRRLVSGVRVGPRRVDLCFTGGLEHVLPGPLGRQRPRTDQGLGQQVARPPVRPAVFGVGVPLAEGDQAPYYLTPAVGVLGQHGEPGAHVLGPFGVMRRQGGHRQRPGPLDGAVGLVELVYRAVRMPGGEAREDPGGAADLVQGDHPAVPVEGGVLDTLGHDGPGGLLEADDELGRAG